MRFGRGLVLVLLAAAVVPPGGADAQDERMKARVSATAPLPPMRPARLNDMPDGAGRSAPAPPPARRTVSSLVEPSHDLPVATRARMHECGAQWQQMKMAGTTGDRIWRAFAQSCLVGQGP